jgi:site-specific DNA-cytosine methylase
MSNISAAMTEAAPSSVQADVQKAGYWFSEKDAKVLDTATHTVIPQNRERIFMVAVSSDHFPSNTFNFPDPVPTSALQEVRETWTSTKRRQTHSISNQAIAILSPLQGSSAARRP